MTPEQYERLSRQAAEQWEQMMEEGRYLAALSIACEWIRKAREVHQDDYITIAEECL